MGVSLMYRHICVMVTIYGCVAMDHLCIVLVVE